MKKLALLVVLVSTLAFGQSAGNPQLGGHWPSLTSYASLNQVAPPADYTFEVTHLDAAHGVDHSVGILTLNPNFYMIKYELLETDIQSGTGSETAAIQAYCPSNYENAFYHYFDDTTVDMSACGGSATTLVPGWGGGSAASRSQARVPSCIFNISRWVWNHADTSCLQPYMKNRSRTDVTTPIVGSAHNRGMFWDEMGSTSGCAGSTCLSALLNPVSGGGHIVELNNENKATLISDGKYQNNLVSLLSAVQSDLVSYTSGDGVTYPNLAECTDTSCTTEANGSGGVLTEFWDTEAKNFTSGLGEQNYWNYADTINGVFIWVEGDYQTPTDPTYNACDYASTDSRHRMWAMSDYWMVKDIGQKRIWYSQYPQSTKTLDQFWYAAQQHDIGQPTGARASIQTGTTSGGYTFNIFERDFTKGKVFVVSRNGYGADTTLSYSERVGTPVSLGGTYHVLNYDNTLGPAITTLQPCYSEAVTLVPDTGTTVSVSPTSATIPVLGSQQFSSTPSGATWSKSSGCTGSIGSTTGSFTASSTVETCGITAIVSGNSGTANVTTQALTVTPSTASLNVGATQQFTANFPSTWSATGGTISGSGLYTAPSTNGTYTITATAINGGTTAMATVTVTGEQTFIPLSISPTSWTQQATISTSVTKTFTATNIGTGSVTPTVTLSGAAAFTISANTCTGAVSGGSNCTVTVQFLSATVGTFSGNLNISDTAGGNQNLPLSVSIPSGTTVSISPTSATIPINGTQQFSASTSNGSGVTWATNCTGSSVTAGNFTAGGSADLCTVTATTTDGSGANAIASVTIVTVAVNPSAVTLQINSKQQFTANVLATWSASCGTITSSGLYTAPAAPTSCTITATAVNGGATGTATATVQNPPPGTHGGSQKGGKGRWKVFH